SYREGVPRGLIEAASMALPVVTTDAPGCREIVEDGGNGLLVPKSVVRVMRSAARIKFF
ncbi:MAG: glycosyltransferase, partial [Candidatus Electrothrix sp. AR4]|nr:glycosyltransferase [Candidatus Electrothrix sp. AR4]